MARPLLLMHGYSATGGDFVKLREMLVAADIDASMVNVGNYVSLNNEVTIPDIAEGLERAISRVPGLEAEGEFDAIVHSTGMLVVRAWLAHQRAVPGENARLKRLKHLVGLAPATWGSPQAHRGRTWLGALVKGDKNLGPDFMNAGKQVLDGLELGSKFTWDLAHLDLLGEKPYFGTGGDTPFVAVFIGNAPYDGLSRLASDPGTDGTVRWSGCGLNTRKIVLDLTDTPTDPAGKARQRVTVTPWADASRLNVPILPVEGRNHGTILADPDVEMVKRVVSFLGVDGAAAYEDWLKEAQAWSEPAFARMKVVDGHFFHLFDKAIEGWQQFVVRARDAHGAAVTDYMIEVFQQGAEDWERCEEMSVDAHAYGADASYRCLHVRLPVGISKGTVPLQIRIQASTGTQVMAYQGYGTDAERVEMRADSDPVKVDITGALASTDATLFHPFTTTMVEIVLNRVPYPFGEISGIFGWWIGSPGKGGE